MKLMRKRDLGIRTHAAYTFPTTFLQTGSQTATDILFVRPRPFLTAAALVVTDLAFLILANGLAPLFRYSLEGAFDVHIFLQLWPTLGLFIIGYFFSQTYSQLGISPVEELRRLSRMTTFVFFVLILALFLVKQLDQQSRLTFVFAWLLSLALVPAGRALLRHACAQASWWGTPVIILGAAKTTELIIHKLQKHPGLALKPIACYDDDSSKHGTRIGGVPVLGSLSDAPILAKQLNITRAIVAMPGVVPGQLSEVVRRCAYAFPHLFFVPNLFGIASLHISAHDLSGVVSLHAKQNLLVYSNRLFKRALDFFLLLPAVLVGAPLVALAALAVFMVSPGNPFYAQVREGYKGKRIFVWKLRTMHKNADALLQKHLAANPEAKKEWESYFKLVNDPRILPGIGHLLRKTSLDELPQLWNIVRGEMSFVGPRPFPFYHLESFNENFRDLRRSVVPGLTGLWQVSARSEGDLLVQEELDSYYIRNWSIWMDLYLIARTPWAVLFGKGAY
jgi:Undecaprenyl-phosphate galactose phosphotransferase WbaP